MKKYILVLLILFAAIAPFFIFKNRFCPLAQAPIEKEKLISAVGLKSRQDIFLNCLKLRKDYLALIEIEKILSTKPDDLYALWGKAEVLRRSHDYKQAEIILNEILKRNSKHPPSLVSLAHIKYQTNRLEEAHRLIEEVLNIPSQDKDNKALAYIILGGINYKRSAKGGLLSKVRYGPRIKGYFLKAKELSPDLPEVHLAMGTFYLLAPKIIGGNLNKAIEELKMTVEIAPEFATVNVRLAQAYKKKGDLEKYNFYLKRAKELDPENEVLREIK